MLFTTMFVIIWRKENKFALQLLTSNHPDKMQDLNTKSSELVQAHDGWRIAKAQEREWGCSPPHPSSFIFFLIFGAPTAYLPAQQQWQNAIYSFHKTTSIVPKVYF